MAAENSKKAVVGRPWPKGVSGNPGGRPKGIAALAREHTDKAMGVLADALLNDDARVRITAAKELLDRGFGKPLTMTADVTRRLDEMDDDELDAALDAVRTAIRLGANAGGGEGSETTH